MKFLNEPIQSTLLSFSKITNIVRDVLKPSETNSSLSNFDSNLTSSLAKSMNQKNRKKPEFNHEGDDMNELLDSMNSENIHISINDGFELVTKVDLGPMPEIVRGPCVCKNTIQYDKDGRVIESDQLKKLIFNGVTKFWFFIRVLFVERNFFLKGRRAKYSNRCMEVFARLLRLKINFFSSIRKGCSTHRSLSGVL